MEEFRKVAISQKPATSLITQQTQTQQRQSGFRLRRQSDSWSASSITVRRSPMQSPSSSYSPSPAHNYLYSMPSPSTYATGDVIASFQLLNNIGSGATCSVFEALDQETDTKVALKIIYKKHEKMGELDHETTVWSRLHHPNILEMIDVIHLEDATVITCELAEGGSLLDHIRTYGKPGLPEITCQRMFHQLLSAVSYLHQEAGLLHRDIKLENILLDRHGNVKLADFGLALDNILIVQRPIEPAGPIESFDASQLMGHAGSMEQQLSRHRSVSLIEPHPKNCIGLCCSSLDQVVQIPNSAYHVSLPRRHKSRSQHAVGSLPYCPPELLQIAPERRALDPVYSSKTDIYSLGCCLYGMLTGSLPFSESFVPRLQLSIMNGRFDHTRLEDTPAAKEVVMGMIAAPESRWSLERIAAHPWVRGGE